tara:strand:- start:77 stop:238 length:162 start_codon:yes stop_codon:yes gene_type:complete
MLKTKTISGITKIDARIVAMILVGLRKDFLDNRSPQRLHLGVKPLPDSISYEI